MYARTWQPVSPCDFIYSCVQVPVGRVLVLDVKEVIANPSRRSSGSLLPVHHDIHPSLPNPPLPPSTDLVGSPLSVGIPASAEEGEVGGGIQGGEGGHGGGGGEQQLGWIIREVQSLGALKERIRRAPFRHAPLYHEETRSTRRQDARQLSSLVETQVKGLRLRQRLSLSLAVSVFVSVSGFVSAACVCRDRRRGRTWGGPQSIMQE